MNIKKYFNSENLQQLLVYISIAIVIITSIYIFFCFFFDIFYASGNLKKLSNKRCKYGLTPTKNESFVMEGFCK